MMYSCKYCPYRSDNKISMVDHVSRHQPTDPDAIVKDALRRTIITSNGIKMESTMIDIWDKLKEKLNARKK